MAEKFVWCGKCAAPRYHKPIEKEVNGKTVTVWICRICQKERVI